MKKVKLVIMLLLLVLTTAAQEKNVRTRKIRPELQFNKFPYLIDKVTQNEIARIIMLGVFPVVKYKNDDSYYVSSNI